jgi:hypothetical protein
LKAVNLCHFLVIKNQYPDPYWYSAKMLDPDLDSMNQDPQHWIDAHRQRAEAERTVQAVSVLTCSPGPGASSFFSASQQRALILNTKTFAVERDLAKECEGAFQTIPLCCTETIFPAPVPT